MTGALREHEQQFPVLQILHGSLDGSDVGLAPLNTENAALFQDPADDGPVHDLLLGHDVDLMLQTQGVGHKEGIAHAGVVGAQQSASLRETLLVDAFGGFKNTKDRPEENIGQQIHDIHACSRSFAMEISRSRLCSRSS